MSEAVERFDLRGGGGGARREEEDGEGGSSLLKLAKCPFHSSLAEGNFFLRFQLVRNGLLMTVPKSVAS